MAFTSFYSYVVDTFSFCRDKSSIAWAFLAAVSVCIQTERYNANRKQKAKFQQQQNNKNTTKYAKKKSEKKELLNKEEEEGKNNVRSHRQRELNYTRTHTPTNHYSTRAVRIYIRAHTHTPRGEWINVRDKTRCETTCAERNTKQNEEWKSGSSTDDLTFVIIVLFVFSYIKLLVNWCVCCLPLCSCWFLLRFFFRFIMYVFIPAPLIILFTENGLHSICYKIYIYVRSVFFIYSIPFVQSVRLPCVSVFFVSPVLR